MISGLEYGAAPIGNLFKEVSDERARAALEAAWDAGVRVFDTAPHYGLGLSERRLGAFLASKPRDEFVLSTKVGRLLVQQGGAGSDLEHGFAVPATHRRVWSADASAVRRSIEESLDRLGLDRIDVAYLHDPDESGRELAAAVEEGLGALVEARDAGLVARIGIGTKSEEAMHLAVQHPIDRIMCSNRWNLVDRSAGRRVLPAAVEAGIEVVAVSVLSSGLLARPRPRADARDEYGPVRPERLALATALADLAERHGVDLPTLALQFPTRHPAVTSVAIGAANPEHVRDAVRRHAIEVPAAAWEALDALQVPA